MKRGRFIAFEGGEAVGKSTQSKLLAEALEQRGVEVVLTREPGGTPGAEAIRSLLLNPPHEGWSARAEALLFAAARADHVEKLIRPALEAGKWVICDRFIDSTRAYQGGGGGLSDAEILDLHRVGSAGLLPDLTLLVEVPVEIREERLARRAAADAIEGREAAYHARVVEAFARFAEAEPQRFVRIAGHGEREETHAQILRAIERLLEQRP
jgi:dTMP kinase